MGKNEVEENKATKGENVKNEMSKDKAQKDKSKEDEVAKGDAWIKIISVLKKALKEEWIRNVFCLLLGSGLTLLGTYAYDWRKEGKAKNNLANMIYIDVEDTKRTMDELIRVNPREKAMEIYKKSGGVIYIKDFDTKMFEAYIQNIPLLSSKETTIIFSFYRDLEYANDALQKLHDKELNMSCEPLTKIFYEKVHEAIKKAKYILKDLEMQYGIKPSKDRNVEGVNDKNIVSGSSTFTYPNVPITTKIIDANVN